MQDSVQQRGRVQSAPHLRLLTWEGSSSELLELVAMRDEGAAARFHDRFGSGMHALVRALIGPDAAHARLVEQSLLAAYAGLFSSRVSPSRLGAWVDGHAVRVVRSYLRRQRFWIKLGARRVRLEPTASDEALLLYERLGDLDPDVRIAFCLRYVAGRALSDTAVLCGVSVAQVRARLVQAEAHLRSVADYSADPDQPELGWES
jgi:DNA-directed RNA polymerase specialized sigma24 family protein